MDDNKERDLKNDETKDNQADKPTTVSSNNNSVKQNDNSNKDDKNLGKDNAVRVLSPARMVLKRFFRSKLSIVSLSILIFLFAFSFLGPLLSPWGEMESDIRPGEPLVSQISRTNLHVVRDADSRLSMAKQALAPHMDTSGFDTSSASSRIYMNALNTYFGGSYGVYTFGGQQVLFTVRMLSSVLNIVLVETDQAGQAVIDPSTGLAVLATTTTLSHTVSPRDRNVWASPSFRDQFGEGRPHPLGTDESAYDILVRLMYGGRISLTLGFVSVAITLFLGLLFGGLAGYFGKWVDNLVMRMVDVLSCLPTLPILLILSAILQESAIDPVFRIYLVMGGMALISWGGTTRFVRGQILSLREQEFMVATEALGLPVSRRIAKHLVPNVIPLLIVSAVTSLGTVIITESSLSFLGLGVPPPRAAWGIMISSVTNPEIMLNFPTQWIPPGIMIVMAVLAFGLLGDSLRDAFDPKAKR